MARESGYSLGLLIPIAVLLIIFIVDAIETNQIKKREEQTDYWRAPQPTTSVSGNESDQSAMGVKPIYDQKKQKEQGVTCGTLVPIIIVGWLFWESRSWIFLIPLLFLVIGLMENLSRGVRGKSRIREEIEREKIGTVSDLSSKTGLTEDKIRQHIVTEKRSGSTDIWFDPLSGEITHSSLRAADEPVRSSVGCSYCGFALKPEDRFCPFCGAPIKAA